MDNCLIVTPLDPKAPGWFFPNINCGNYPKCSFFGRKLTQGVSTNPGGICLIQKILEGIPPILFLMEFWLDYGVWCFWVLSHLQRWDSHSFSGNSRNSFPKSHGNEVGTIPCVHDLSQIPLQLFWTFFRLWKSLSSLSLEFSLLQVTIPNSPHPKHFHLSNQQTETIPKLLQQTFPTFLRGIISHQNKTIPNSSLETTEILL